MVQYLVAAEADIALPRRMLFNTAARRLMDLRKRWHTSLPSFVSTALADWGRRIRATALFGDTISLRHNRLVAKPSALSLRLAGSGPLGYQLVVFNSSMLRKIEHRFLIVPADLEIAARCKYLVTGRRCQGDDLTGGRYNATAGQKITAFLFAGFGNTNNPSAVLVGASLHAKMIVKVG